MEKVLSIVVPSYNSEKWLGSCLDSLLIGLDDKIEVIVVNDGSKDETSKIAHEYASKHSFISVIDKENGGHGSGINAGLKIAKGLYFKVLDSDDHLDKDGLYKVIETIERHQKEGNLPDFYLTDYKSVSTYDGKEFLHSMKQRFSRVNEVVGWDGFEKLKTEEYFMIHQSFVRTEMLKETKMNLIEKTFYEDNQFMYHVLIHAKSMCYIDTAVYLYSMGRDEQSVSVKNMAKNCAHQMRVFRACIDMCSYEDMMKMEKAHKDNVLHEFFSLNVLTYFYTYIDGNREKVKQFKEVNKYFKQKDKKLYNKIRWRTPIFWTRLIPPITPLRKLACRLGYKYEGKKIGWRV